LRLPLAVTVVSSKLAKTAKFAKPKNSKNNLPPALANYRASRNRIKSECPAKKEAKT
jgi:hypothetical protein